MKNCTMCGSPLPDSHRHKICSMCYGDIDYAFERYYRQWAFGRYYRQWAEDRERERQPQPERPQAMSDPREVLERMAKAAVLDGAEIGTWDRMNDLEKDDACGAIICALRELVAIHTDDVGRTSFREIGEVAVTITELEL